MAIPFADNLAIKNRKQNVERDSFKTIQEMKNFSENYLPNVFPATCEEDGRLYIYNIKNDLTEETGRWRPVGNGKGSVDFNDLLNKPTKLSDFNNDKGYVSNIVDDLVNYYKKSDTYTSEEIDQKIGAIATLSMLIVDELPETGSSKVIYLTPKTTTSGYVEWIYSLGKWSEIGDTDIDLSEYIKRNELSAVATSGKYEDLDNKPELVVIDDENISEKSTYSSKMIDELIGESATTADNVSYKNETYPEQTTVEKALNAIWEKLDYVKPSITSFSMAPSITEYEVGQEVTELDFTWGYNKSITSQSLTDVSLDDLSVRTGKWTGTLKTNKTFTLTCGDGKNTASASKTISFKNKVYWGGASIPSDYDSAFILGLEKKQFSTTKNGSYSMTVGEGEYGYIAFPSSFGALSSVWIGGFEVTIEDCGSISFTNASGGVVTYSIYRTKRSGLGPITMEVK